MKETSSYKKGEADCIKGVFDPPSHPFIMPESKREYEEKAVEIQDYRRGYYTEKNKNS
jgi:hypothetical protein